MSKERPSRRPEAARTSGRGMNRDELSRHEREVRAQRYILMGIAALIVVVVGIVAFGWWSVYYAKDNESVATVGGQKITLDQYARRLDLQRKDMEQQLQQMQLAYQANQNSDLAQLYQQQIQQVQFSLALLPEQTLDSMIAEQLVRQEAARRGITVTPDEIDAEVKKTFGDPPTPVPQPTEASAPGAAGEATAVPSPAPTDGPGPTPVPTADIQARMNQVLAQYGMTDSELRSIFETQLLAQKLQTAMGSEIPAFEEQVHARHILVDSEDKAREVLDKLKAGARFEDLAAQYSTDTSTKDKGGDLGWFPRGAMVPEFDAAAFQLPVNEFSDPVKTSYGYHIIQVLEKDPNRPLDDQTLNQKKSQAFNDWVTKEQSGPAVTRNLSQDQKDWVYAKIKWSPPGLGQ